MRWIVVLALGLATRVGALVWSWPYTPSGDAADYARHGVSLDLHGRFAPTLLAAPGGPSALRPPLYPLLLGGVFKVVPDTWTGARVADVLLGVLTVALVGLIAARVWGERAGLLAAAIAAAFPPLVFLPASLLSENLFLPLLLGCVACLLRVGSWRRAVGAGVLLGAAVITRGNALFVVPAVVVALWRRPRELALVAVACVVVLVPWTVRNESAFGAFVPFGTQSGYTLAGAYNSQADRADALQGVWRTAQDTPDYAPLFHRRGTDEAELDAELRRRALRYARHHAAYVATVVRLNALRLFDLGPGHAFVSRVGYGEMAVPRGAGVTVLRIGLYATLALALLGLVALARRRVRAGPLWLWLVPLALLASVVFELGNPRYRAPADPFLCLLAALAFSSRQMRWGPSG